MNSILNKIFFLFILFILFVESTPATARGQGGRNTLTIIFTSGLAEIYLDQDQGGYAELQTFLKTVRNANEQLLFIHGGGALSPGILSTIDKGAHIISLLNDLKPDIMAVGKADLAHQEDELSLRSFEATFPITNCNMYDPLTGGQPEGILPYFLKKIGGVTIGFLSVVDPEVMTDYMPQRIRIIDMNKAVADNALKLRKKGADIIILVAGLSLDSFNRSLSNPPVDVVLLSNTSSEKTGLTQQGNSLFELNGHQGTASIITLNFSQKNGKTGWTGAGKLFNLNDYARDQKTHEKIETYLAQLSGLQSHVIGMTRTDIDTRREAMRKKENGFANLAADVLRAHYKSDIALINGGSFRANKQYPTGSNITVGDIQKELPFNNKVVNIKISGENIRKTIERGLSRIEELKGCFPHVSGLQVAYNPNNAPFHRVLSIDVQGTPLEPNKLYTLTTIDFLANGGDGFLELQQAERIVKIGETRLLWDYIRDYIEKKGAIAPKVDGRMRAFIE